MKIVVTSPFDLSEGQREQLRSLGEVVFHDTEPSSTTEWLERCAGFDIVCSGKPGMTHRHTNEELAIYSLGSGTTVVHPFVNVAMIDANRLHEQGVRLGFSPGCNRKAVAEWSMYMLLDLFRGFSQRVNLIDPSIPATRTRSLIDARLLIYGAGNVGEEIAYLASCFEMEVELHTRESGCALEHLAAFKPDAVVNALSSLPENSGYFDEKFFAAMPAGSFFVTMTSPTIWNIEHLLTALDNDHLGGAAIDVGAGAPGDVTFPTYLAVAQHTKVRATAQIAHFSDHSAETSFEMMIENVRAAAAEDPLPYPWE